MEKTIRECTIRTKEDINQLKRDFEKVSIKVAITGLLLVVGPIMLAGICQIIFIVNPIDQLLSHKYGYFIFIVCVFVLLEIFTRTKISKEHARLHLIVREVKKYEEMLSLLQEALKENNRESVRNILTDLEGAEEIFGNLEEYQEAIAKAKEFLIQGSVGLNTTSCN